MTRQIVVTGDVLRPFPGAGGAMEPATWRNVRWLHALVAPALRAIGREVACVAWDDTLRPEDGRFFDTPDFYRRAEQPLSLEGWSHLSAAPLPSAELRARVCEAFAGAVVVGCELPRAMVHAFAEGGIPFVDLSSYPLRFLDDLVFAMRTNRPEWHNVLRAYRPGEDVPHRQAALIRAKAAWMDSAACLPPESVLILGQVAADGVLRREGGGFWSLGDHMERLHRLCCEHPKVLFKPHPYDAPGSASQQAMRRLGCVEWTSGNFYWLLSQPNLARVVGLNSSGLAEAPYFGKVAENLIPFPHAFDGTPPDGGGEPGSPVPLTGDWIEPGFWSALLDGAAPAPDRGPMPPNRFRRTLNADWGYGFIEQVVCHVGR